MREDDLKKGMLYKRLVALFLVAFTVRMVFSLFIFDHPERVISPDSPLYIQLAENLLGSQTFPSIFRTPVYPSFIALIYGLFGHFPQAVITAQCFTDSLTAIVVVFVFLEIFRKVRYAYIAGFLYAVSPFAVFYSQRIRSETLFTFILTASVYFLVMFFNKNKKRYLIASSLLLGSGVLCRPIALYLPLVLVPFIFMNGFRLRDRLIHCLIFLFSFSIVLIPWYIRNYQQYEYLGIATVKEINMACYEAPNVLMMKDDLLSIIRPGINESFYKYQMVFWEMVKKQHGWEIASPCGVQEETEKLAIIKKEGERIVKENIPLVLLSHTAGIGRTLCPYPPHFERLTGSHATTARWIAFLIDAAVTGLSLLGMFFALRGPLNLGRGRFISVALLFLILYLTFIPGIVGYPRFKVPVLPLICIFASFGLGRTRKDIETSVLYHLTDKIILNKERDKHNEC